MAESLGRWLNEQDLPADGQSDCLLMLHTGAILGATCNVSIGDQVLKSSKHFTFKFNIGTDPLCPHFIVEILLAPIWGNKSTAEERNNNKRMRMSAVFLAYDAVEPGKHGSRTPGTYDRRATTPPSGPLSFSPQLEDVRFSHGDSKDTPQNLLDLETVPEKHFCYTWRAKRCVQLKMNMPLDKLSPEARDAAKKFKEMIGKMLSRQQRIHIVTKSTPRMALVWWPLFQTLPAPVPESYFLWLYKFNPAAPFDVMKLPSNQTFERMPDLVDRLLGVRKKNWHKRDDPNYEDVRDPLPQPVKIAKLYPITHFFDERHYIAAVLGCAAYEDQHATATTNTYFNGSHRCDVFTSLESHGWMRRYLVMLSIHPPTKAEMQETGGDGALPVVGERVQIDYGPTGWSHTLHGRVERVPQAYLKDGYNVCVVAQLPSTAVQRGAIDQNQHQLKAHFHFGLRRSLSTPTQQRVISLMTGTNQKIPGPGAEWLKTLLLGHDNYRETPPAFSLPSDWRTTVDKVCNRRELNAQLRAAIECYFTHRILLVRSPPGTEKSTLIDAIVELEEAFSVRFWVVTHSNPACDVLVLKTATRKGNLQPRGVFRVKSIAEERLTWSGPRLDEIDALDDQPVRKGQESAAQATHRMLTMQENVARAMSLDAAIKDRFKLRPAMLKGERSPLYSKELEHLAALSDAAKDSNLLRAEGRTEEEYASDQFRYEKRYLKALRTCQRNYVSNARGVYSTANAADEALLRDFKPRTIIMDEASQFMEARAVSAIIHAFEGGNVQRLLLVGDYKQIPLTLFAPRNPFSRTGMVSFFDRLLETGARSISLGGNYQA